MNKLWIRYWDILSGLFDRIEGWEGVEEHQALKKPGEELLLCGGWASRNFPLWGYFVGFTRQRPCDRSRRL